MIQKLSLLEQFDPVYQSSHNMIMVQIDNIDSKCLNTRSVDISRNRTFVWKELVDFWRR